MTLDPDRPPVSSHDPLDDGKPEATAATTAPSRGVGPVEALKDMR
jgi:hypothetical protein